MTDADRFLRRFERDAWVSCAVMAGVALVVTGGEWQAGASVAGGGALAAISYGAIKGAVQGVGRGAGQRAALVKFFTRYAMLALAAYVMLARVRLHPVGVVAGASSLVVAAMIAAARGVWPPARSRRDRGSEML
jgi:hypothetical protein